MAYTAPDHYSYKFKFNLDKLPASRTDRTPCRIGITGLFIGILFMLIGGYELIAFLLNFSDESYDFALPSDFSSGNLMLKRYAFDTFILLFGLIIVSLSVMALKRYKSIFFDGDNIKIEHQPLFGKTETLVEALYNYIGVLLKVEYYQFGLINRNRYIIELYHKEKEKRIPLYISTSGRNIRRIWEYYAAKLKMPALFMTDHGLVSRHHNELDKTLKDMSKRWHLKALYHEQQKVPPSLKYKIKKDKVIFKEQRLFFDIYTILAVFGVIILGALMCYAGVNAKIITNYISTFGFIASMLICLLITMLSLLSIFSKDVLIVTKNAVILGHNISFLRIDAEAMSKESIEAVDIGHNPITDRYYLSIISHEHSMIFGKNMPIDDLRWIRGNLIREIVR